MMDLNRAYYEAVRDCTPEDCGDCILVPDTNRACHMVDVDPRDEAAFVLALMDERDRYRVALEELLPLVMDYRDDGAYPEDWQSAELRAALFNARAALEPR